MRPINAPKPLRRSANRRRARKINKIKMSAAAIYGSPLITITDNNADIKRDFDARNNKEHKESAREGAPPERLVCNLKYKE